PRHHMGRGIGLAVLAFGFYSTQDMLIKRLSSRYPLPEIIFCIGLFGLLPLLLSLLLTGGSLRTQRLGLHLVRGMSGLIGALGSFFAYSRMPLADVYAIAFS